MQNIMKSKRNSNKMQLTAINDKHNTRSLVISVFFLLLVTCVGFVKSVEMRREWFGQFSPNYNQVITGTSIKFVRNWLEDGIVEDRFALFSFPKSVEYSELDQRVMYSSYPPGAFLPLYGLAKLFGNDASTSFVMSYNLLNHVLCTFSISLLAFFTLRKARVRYVPSVFLSVIPLALFLFLPGNMYWFQNVYFSDQAVILPFILFLLLEVLQDNLLTGRKSKLLSIFQSIIFFWGSLTDWLFLFVGLAVYLKRIVHGDFSKKIGPFIGKSLAYWSPLISAWAIFVTQVWLLGGMDMLIYNFFFRTGIRDEYLNIDDQFLERFWLSNMVNNYSKYAIPMVWGSLLIFLVVVVVLTIKKLKKKSLDPEIVALLSSIGVVLVPAYLQVYFLKNHSIIHDFSTLKFSLLLSLVPFVYLPVLFLMLLNNKKENYWNNIFENMQDRLGGVRKQIGPWLFVLTLVVCSSLFLMKIFPMYHDLFPSPMSLEIEDCVADNTEYSDVVFSPSVEILKDPSIAYSMKVVHRFTTIADMTAVTEGINEKYNVMLLIADGEVGEDSQLVNTLINRSDVVVTGGRCALYQMSDVDFSELVQESTILEISF